MMRAEGGSPQGMGAMISPDFSTCSVDVYSTAGQTVALHGDKYVLFCYSSSYLVIWMYKRSLMEIMI